MSEEMVLYSNLLVCVCYQLVALLVTSRKEEKVKTSMTTLIKSPTHPHPLS